MKQLKQLDAIVGETLMEGTPNEIITRLSLDITEALQAANVALDGIHIYALVHVLCCAIKVGQLHPDTNGPMPSFGTILSALTRNISGTKWSPEESAVFDEEFGRIVTAMGGKKIGVRGGPTLKNGRLIMSPSLGVH